MSELVPDTPTSIEAEIAILRTVLVKLGGNMLAQAPDGWYAVEPTSKSGGPWVKFAPDEQEAIQRAYQFRERMLAK
jgi:hypothetical protein